MEPVYYISGINFENLSVGVSKCRGLLDKLKMKELKKYSWPEEHGEAVDLTNVYYEGRDIELDCFLWANNSMDFISKLNTFLGKFQDSSSKRLMIVIDEAKPLVYEVYAPDLSSVEKEWSNTEMIGEFTLKLREPEPVKRVVKFTATEGNMTVNISFTALKRFNAYFGDGEHLYDIYGLSQAISHTYKQAGTYYIILTGDLSFMLLLTTNGSVIWNKLQ